MDFKDILAIIGGLMVVLYWLQMYFVTRSKWYLIIGLVTLIAQVCFYQSLGFTINQLSDILKL